MFLELTDYQEELRALSGAIKSLLDVDVIIVDRWLTQLVNTFHYSREPLDIRVNSIVGNVIVTGEVQIVPNRRDNRSCMSCPDYSLCELDSVVGVPLKSGEDCVGALLVMFSIRRSVLLENQAEQLVTFLSRLGALIVRMMEADRLGIQVDRLQQNTEGLLDQLADAVAAPATPQWKERMNSTSRPMFRTVENSRNSSGVTESPMLRKNEQIKL